MTPQEIERHRRILKDYSDEYCRFVDTNQMRHQMRKDVIDMLSALLDAVEGLQEEVEKIKLKKL